MLTMPYSVKIGQAKHYYLEHDAAGVCAQGHQVIINIRWRFTSVCVWNLSHKTTNRSDAPSSYFSYKRLIAIMVCVIV